MKSISNLKELFSEQLIELYNVEKLEHKALQKIHGKAGSEDLKSIIRGHIDETDVHLKRLEDVADELDVSLYENHADAIRGVIRRGEDIMDRCTDSEIIDAAIVTAIQSMQHYEIAKYGSACNYANELGLKDIADKLHLTLDEEKEVDLRLIEIASEQINSRAVVA